MLCILACLGEVLSQCFTRDVQLWAPGPFRMCVCVCALPRIALIHARDLLAQLSIHNVYAHPCSSVVKTDTVSDIETSSSVTVKSWIDENKTLLVRARGHLQPLLAKVVEEKKSALQNAMQSKQKARPTQSRRYPRLRAETLLSRRRVGR